MNRNHLLFLIVFVLTVFIASCEKSAPLVSTTATGQPEIPTDQVDPAPSITPDICSTGQVDVEVQKVHSHMREFDDASILASNLPQEQLSESIANLQRIRRESEDEQIPNCLTDLKSYQLDHMNSVIDTLVAFIGGTDTESLERGISIAREQHDQYTLELARLLGLTVVPATVPVISTPAQTATP
jgi:hypothetical protein